MCDLLAFEADRRSFLITINSFGTELTKEDRAKLYPRCGKLHPYGLGALAKADDFEQVRRVADYYLVCPLCGCNMPSVFIHFNRTLVNF